jgi:hypothetical protein
MWLKKENPEYLTSEGDKRRTGINRTVTNNTYMRVRLRTLEEA